MHRTAELPDLELLQETEQVEFDPHRIPLMARRSVLQLLLRPGLMGFSNLVWVSGDWRGLASPFCRLGREVPSHAEAHPETVLQTSEHAEMRAAFCGPDSVAIEIESRIAQTLYSGAPGKIYHNGGTAQQQWMAFDPFRQNATLEQCDDRTVMARNGAYVAVFAARGIRLAEDGNGWTVPVPQGRTHVGVGAALGDPLLARARALSALDAVKAPAGIATVCGRLEAEWDEILNALPLPADLDADTRRLARNALWCIYSNLAPAEGCLTRECVLASKIQYPGLYPWDSAFASLALKEVDPQLARNQILAYADQIQASTDGQAGEMTAHHTGGGAQFPFFAWVAWRIHQSNSDVEFLTAVYEPLSRHADWWLQPERTIRGVPAYMRIICLDDSPRFDVFANEGRMSLKEPVLGADLITICAFDQLHLALMAEALGKSDRARAHRDQARRLTDFAETHLYDETLGRYIDLGTVSGRRGSVNTPMNHFPALLSPSNARRAAAVAALSRRGPFFGRYGLATVAPEEASFDPCRIWRGPIWLNINLLCAEACTQMGAHDVADEIARSSIDLIRANDPLPTGIMEYYNYQTGQGSGAIHFATLGAAPFLSFLLGHHTQGTAIRPEP